MYCTKKPSVALNFLYAVYQQFFRLNLLPSPCLYWRMEMKKTLPLFTLFEQTSRNFLFKFYQLNTVHLVFNYL